jgi:hypothetical protein
MPPPGKNDDIDKRQWSTLTTNNKDGDPRHLSYQRLAKQYRTEVAASTSSVLSTMVAFPLDSVKTRMQTYGYSGFLDCVRQTYRTERLRGFFRGVTAPMASIALVRTVSFSIYQRSKYAYRDWIKRHFGVDVLQHLTKPGTYPTWSSSACIGAAGATAGACISFIACASCLLSIDVHVELLLTENSPQKAPSSLRSSALRFRCC